MLFLSFPSFLVLVHLLYMLQNAAKVMCSLTVDLAVCVKSTLTHMVNVFLHYLVKYKCKQKLTIITKI